MEQSNTFSKIFLIISRFQQTYMITTARYIKNTLTNKKKLVGGIFGLIWVLNWVCLKMPKFKEGEIYNNVNS